MAKQKAQAAGYNLSLADLIPERDTFTDEAAGDENATGKVYEFRARVELNAAETARAISLGDKIAKAMKRISRQPDEPRSKQALEQFTVRFMGIILPDLPLERVKQMHFGQRQAIIEWWQSRNEKTAANGSDPNMEEAGDWDDAGEA